MSPLSWKSRAFFRSLERCFHDLSSVTIRNCVEAYGATGRKLREVCEKPAPALGPWPHYLVPTMRYSVTLFRLARLCVPKW